MGADTNAEEDAVPSTQPSVAARKRGRPTEAERAQRVDDVLDAAVRLFARDGFDQVTLDAVAAEARVTKRTIYSYVGDRTEVFLAAVGRLREHTLHGVGLERALEPLAHQIVRTLHSDAAISLHRLVIAESQRFPELAARFYDEGPRRYVAALRERLPESHRPQAEALFALLLGEPHRQRLLGLRPAPDDDVAASHAVAALRIMGIDVDKESER
jgi:AcrR family transcriptional regulator